MLSAPVATASSPVELIFRNRLPTPLRISVICVLRLTSEPSTAENASVALSYTPCAIAPLSDTLVIAKLGAVQAPVAGSNAVNPPK
ncbi:hypothetical protein D3C71_1301350 [compost metagenome]